MRWKADSVSQAAEALQRSPRQIKRLKRLSMPSSRGFTIPRRPYRPLRLSGRASQHADHGRQKFLECWFSPHLSSLLTQCRFWCSGVRTIAPTLPTLFRIGSQQYRIQRSGHPPA
jgi:hypothetical protein